MTKYGVFIGRFQPFHKGHEAVIREIIADGLTPLIFIGCSEHDSAPKNPYTFRQRQEMIGVVFPKVSVRVMFDTPSDDVWAGRIKQSIGATPFVIYYHRKEEDVTDGLHYIERCFLGMDLKIVQEKSVDISATDIRKALDHTHDSTLRQITSNKFLKIKEVSTVVGTTYYYAERLGVDSVAFVLYNPKTELYGLINEYKPPIGQFMITAFGGSIDSDKSKEEIVKQEVLEESGYIAADIQYIGRCFVSTQMNQFCYLYCVPVVNYVGKTTTDPTESRASVVWMEAREILKLEDWKAKSIIFSDVVDEEILK